MKTKTRTTGPDTELIDRINDLKKQSAINNVDRVVKRDAADKRDKSPLYASAIVDQWNYLKSLLNKIN